MKIQIVSDLHREFGVGHNAFSPEHVVGDILLIAGDICNDIDELEFFLRSFSPTPVFFVLGNHEYYTNDFDLFRRRAHGKLHRPQDNIFLLDNTEVTLEKFPGYTFVGATLWTNIPIVDRFTVQKGMNDYNYIFRGQSRITPEFTVEEHKRSAYSIIQSLSYRPNKKIVLTHHLPSFSSVSERYSDSSLNVAYATSLDELITNYQPALWVHGHTHTNHDYKIGDTRIVCNPYGYYNQQENPDFRHDFVVEV